MSEGIETYSTASVASMLVHIHNIIISLLAPIVLISGLYGIFFAISIASLYVQWNKLKSTPSTLNRIMMLVGLTLFGSTTAYYSLKVSGAFITAKAILTSQSNLVDPLSASAYEANGGMLDGVFASAVLMLITVWIADAVVVWRACVIWSNDIKIVVVLGTALLLTFAATIWNLVCVSIHLSYRFGPVENEGGAAKADQNMNLTDDIRLVTSLVTNWLATLAIGYKLWSYRKNILPPLRHSSQKVSTPIYVIFTNLVEMGLFLGVYQIVVTALWINLSLPGSSRRLAYNHIFLAFPFFAALNPILTILLVNKNRSITESSKDEKSIPRLSRVEGAGGARHQLVFAHTPESTLNETDETGSTLRGRV